MYGFPWSPTHVAILRELWADPDMSAAAIAREIGGLSRNAVIGKAHRIGLPKRLPVKRAAPVKGQAKNPTPAQIPAVQPHVEVLTPMHRDDGAPVTLLTVCDGECRFPVGPVPPNGDMPVCGHAVARGAYCAGHAAVAYMPQREKRELDRKLGIPKFRGRA